MPYLIISYLIILIIITRSCDAVFASFELENIIMLLHLIQNIKREEFYLVFDWVICLTQLILVSRFVGIPIFKAFKTHPTEPPRGMQKNLDFSSSIF